MGFDLEERSDDALQMMRCLLPIVALAQTDDPSVRLK